MTRIVAGLAGGRVLKVPPKGTRPTSERVREAIFSRLEHYDLLRDTKVLDLYAGSGALGLEAASRGAREVLLVEAHKAAAGIARDNATKLGLAGVSVRCDRAEHVAGLPTSPPWDVVFLDPPYDLSNERLHDVLAALVPHVDERAVIVIERSARSGMPLLPKQWRVMTSKTYGESTVYYVEPEVPLVGYTCA
ncbi:16S rRNA (guanine(966)-N(2))-methyltransferase RsmD [Jonesia denitrificans]|uniref:Methyltransferase n=1 Tax=Jonesia denitrificans (strain ATCC 14870 / DSM 20603 / BCRC 15368 / CIP 55.134 / JCM 11481 / NBRC 15587 / NCTC 10816 / Prevot 55134) TaxID=471856 RepID=C7QYT1_JONDD|nr:16S rRNA (guanine(966)-N(2))-methyltransferase RsmD [Jonesia denitrificans]ACV09320.1 methyltransferase [Jonesia denitrificans DSM 20603]ASE09427.1 16S rRNA (guanine(966)-N(2))-methyltransferase RsmD [Jonesia denitrificans]QXB43973.1 16S rRNA (guanine(966)-N(2))-methyltransferase RsmD [Jonesia denitrificans]SQH21587.1 Ribosomal RNA small subunit methyltransferase D [Jonesia denitrificans]